MTEKLKEWLTAAEIAKLGIWWMPTTKMGVLLFFKRNLGSQHKEFVRKRKGRGGGSEYNIRLVQMSQIMLNTNFRRSLMQAFPTAISLRLSEEKDRPGRVVVRVQALSRPHQENSPAPSE